MNARTRIGRQLAAMRREQGLTQRALASRCGVLQPHIARIEAGSYSVGLDTLETIARAMGAQVAILPFLSDSCPNSDGLGHAQDGNTQSLNE